MTSLLACLRGDIERLDPTLLETLQHPQEKVQYRMERRRAKVSRADYELLPRLLAQIQTDRPGHQVVDL
jgi:hypothetical protein